MGNSRAKGDRVTNERGKPTARDRRPVTEEERMASVALKAQNSASETIHVRVTPRMLLDLQNISRKQTMTVSDLVRMTIKDAMPRLMRR